MDNKYENIVPWNGANDTGRDVRLKLERNFSRVAANFFELADKDAELEDWINAIVEELKNFLRKDPAGCNRISFEAVWWCLVRRVC